MKYSDKLIEMRGIITEVHDGSVSIDFKGRLGHMDIPLRMLITDYAVKQGMEISMTMSFPEVVSGEVNEKYINNTKYKSEG